MFSINIELTFTTDGVINIHEIKTRKTISSKFLNLENSEYHHKYYSKILHRNYVKILVNLILNNKKPYYKYSWAIIDAQIPVKGNKLPSKKFLFLISLYWKKKQELLEFCS